MAADDLDALFDLGLPAFDSPTAADRDRLYARIREVSKTNWRVFVSSTDPINLIRIRFDSDLLRERVLRAITGSFSSKAILGNFMLQPSDEKAQPVGDSVGPLSFKDTVAVLIADYGASAHQACDIVTSAARNETSDLMSAVTYKGVRITYSA